MGVILSLAPSLARGLSVGAHAAPSCPLRAANWPSSSMTGSALRCIRSGCASAAGIRAAWTCAPDSDCTIPRISTRTCPSPPSASPNPGAIASASATGTRPNFSAGTCWRRRRSRPRTTTFPRRVLWDAATGEVRRFAWTAKPDDAQLDEWLRQFLEAGFIVFSGVPVRPGSLFSVGGTFGFTRETNFGALFDVRSTAEASDLAYTSLAARPAHGQSLPRPGAGRAAAALPRQRDLGRALDAGRRLCGGAGPRGA